MTKQYPKPSIIILLFSFVVQSVWAQFTLHSGQTSTISCHKSEEAVVLTAISLFQRDYQAVFSAPLQTAETQGDIIVSTVGKGTKIKDYDIDLTALTDKKEAFLLKVLPDGKLLIAGSDSHGTAYGILELSRLIGVSPWEWWADATPEKKERFTIPSGYQDLQYPSVEYRGIFINDEDWGLMPWSSRHYEPSEIPGQIGPKTNEKIFELLLRLRANSYWPAMHECTYPFFLTKGNREVAEKFGIYIGGSHCEPMACSTAIEWHKRGKGAYDYVNNDTAVYQFWEERVKEVAGQEILYTIGMRGIHDGAMNGAKGVAGQKAALERVFTDQRRLLQRYVNKDITAVPQVFIPYKEVLDVYNAGLKVPEDVTLMWCDDNYGYIRHFPTAEEQTRRGGNGIYYHVSYWGRPHDYLWLGTFSPALLYHQMKLAYERGIQKMWILNVGDIKPSEYQIELFMDMAWNMDKMTEEGWSSHLETFLSREFGKKTGKKLLPILKEHYRLAYIRKPEFMGNTREEEYDKTYRIVKDLPWDETYIQNRLEEYQRISNQTEQMAAMIEENRQDTYFQLVKYPIQAAAEMNKKMLYAQLARHRRMEWDKSDAAYDSIVSLTHIYNKGIKNDGKWELMMDYRPRRLPVFNPVSHTNASSPMPPKRAALYRRNATECDKGRFIPCEGLGYEGKAATIAQDETITFNISKCPTDSIDIEVRLLPSHPVKGKHLRFILGWDGQETSPISYETEGRNEEWKENKLRNQSVKNILLPVTRKKRHQLSIKALDEGVVLDQIIVFPHKR